MKLSVIIPHYPKTPELEDLLSKCEKSFKGHDELVVVVNFGIGFAKAVNYGLKAASGDYLIVLNNDTVIQGDLRDLMNPEAVTSPVVNNRKQDFWGCCFCIPKWVYEKIGGLDEQFEVGYFEDDDYIMRLKEANIPMKCVETVRLTTEGGSTLHLMENKYNENQIKFNKKWGSGTRK